MGLSQDELHPGWRWSNDMRPVVGTVSCEVEHKGIMLSGVLRVELDDGRTIDLFEGDVYVIPAGHDAWVVGDQTVRTIEYSSETMFGHGKQEQTTKEVAS